MEKNLREPDRHTQRTELGRFGEEQASHFLREKGFKILDRNFHAKGGEIDIVARAGELVVFVEVKTRTSTNYARPEEAVGYRKRENLKTAARHYIQEHPHRGNEFRFDVISVTINESECAELEWIQNAF